MNQMKNPIQMKTDMKGNINTGSCTENNIL